MCDFIIFAAVMAGLFLLGFLYSRRLARRDFEEKMKKLTMPSGELVPCDEELLKMERSEFETWPKDDLKWLINYVGHKTAESIGQELKDWEELFTLLSSIKNAKGWNKNDPAWD
ncbi:MAG: hypothetical protein IJ830_05535 [Alphaproteobacteria bacterium]|nr:hypothetical protein [Alphaproteobacteria bacterium]